MYGGWFGASNSISKNQEQVALQQQQQKEREQEAKAKQAKEKKETIIEFAKRNGVNLSYTYQERDRYLNRAVRELSYSAVPLYQPTYTRGVVRGSFADNVSVLANAQKKKEYDELMDSKNEARSEGVRAKWDYDTKAKEIISALKKIPNSEEYVKYEEEQHTYNMSILNKC